MKKQIASLLAMGLSAALFLGACGMDKNATVISVKEGEGISLGYANFVAKLMQAQYDINYRRAYGDQYWSTDLSGKGKTLEANVKENLVDMLKQQYVSRQHASEFDVSISDEEKQKIEDAAKKFMQSNSQEAIEQLGASQDYVVRFFQEQYYYYHVEQILESKADTSVSDEEANQKKFSYVKFAFTTRDSATGTSHQATDEEKADLLKQAQSLATAADFDATAKQMNASVQTATYGKDDIGSSSYPLSQEVLKAAENLAVGKVSDVVTVDNDGYYVLRMDSLSDADATASKRDSLSQQKMTDYATNTMKQWEEEDGMQLNESLWSQVKFRSLFESKGANSTGASGNSAASSGTGSSAGARGQ